MLARPRGGGFVYDGDEIDLVAADIAAAVSAGAGGVVVGALTPTGQADLAAVARWRDAAGTATLVFHRAIDATPDPLAVLAQLRGAGVDRVLTSGGAVRSIDGLDTLAGADRDQAAALLRDAAERAASAPRRRRSRHGETAGGPGRPLTIVASARREGAALDLLSDAHRPGVSALALTAGSASAPASASTSSQVIS